MRIKDTTVLLLPFFILFSASFIFGEAQRIEDVSDVLFYYEEVVRLNELAPLSNAEVSALRDSLALPNLEQSSCESAELFDTASYAQRRFIRFDVNDDNHKDIIFTGQCTGEEKETLVWIASDDGYLFQFYFPGDCIKAVRLSDTASFSLLTRTGRCCDGVIDSYRLYASVGRIEDTCYINSILLRSFSTDAVLPSEVDRLHRLTVIQEECTLRQTPEMNDRPNSEAEVSPTLGNVIARFKKGSTGIAYAVREDSVGKSWSYVIFDPDSETSYNNFPNDILSLKAGWIETAGVLFNTISDQVNPQTHRNVR